MHGWLSDQCGGPTSGAPGLPVVLGWTHRVSAHHLWVVDHRYQVNDGEGGIEHVGAEEVLVEGDPLAAQTPVDEQ